MSRRTQTAIMYGVIIVLCIGIGTSIMLLLSRPEQVSADDSDNYGEISSEDIVMVEESSVEENSSEEQKIVPVDRLMITGDNVNVRSGPATDADRLGSAYRGYDFEYLGVDDSGEWFKITYDGKTGYVFKDYGEVKKMYQSEDGSYLEY